MAVCSIVAPRRFAAVAAPVERWLRTRRLRPRRTVTGAHVTIDCEWSGRGDLCRVLAGVVALNVAALRIEPVPPLYSSGVVYRREPMCIGARGRHRCEEFLSAHETIARGAGDCDDLAPWLAAERRLAGERANAMPRRAPGVGWHVVVLRPDGSTEDPSRRLGM